MKLYIVPVVLLADYRAGWSLCATRALCVVIDKDNTSGFGTAGPNVLATVSPCSP